MADLELRKLWKLHLVDHQLADIRLKAAALDPGRKIQAELAALKAAHDAQAAHVKSLVGNQTDIELEQKSLDEKLKRIDKDLYGGKVVNPKEVALLEKEIEHLKSLRGDLDLKILEIWDALPSAKKEADASQAEITAKNQELAEAQRKVLVIKAQLEKDFKERAAMRPQLAKEVSAPLLGRYELIRQKHAGVGMAGVSRKATCEACGTNVPTKSVMDAKDGKLVTCEACHRILYASDGLI
jgi:hypothetical protein